MSKTILVVEDEPEIRELAVETLRQAGHFVLEAASGCALQWSRNNGGYDQ